MQEARSSEARVLTHYSDVIMGAVASQITGPTIVYSTVYSGANQRKHQSSASLAFVRGIHRWSVNSPHKGPVTRKMFPFHDVIMMPEYSAFDTIRFPVMTLTLFIGLPWLTAMNLFICLPCLIKSNAFLGFFSHLCSQSILAMPSW